MLRVVYEATTDLNPGQLVEIQETRGRVTVKIRAGVSADKYVPPLNAELERFVGKGTWFQIWRGQIIGANHPENPLTVQYEVDPQVDRRQGAQIRESKGLVRLHIYPDLTAEELARAVNRPIELFLAGGQWFQFWQGEIVTGDDAQGNAAA